MEKEAVRRRVGKVERGRPMVVALGGGAFTDEANQALLFESGVTIWLDCSFPRVCARVEGSSHRPLARDPEQFQQLYQHRQAAYSKAEYRIEIENGLTDDVSLDIYLGVFTQNPGESFKLDRVQASLRANLLPEKARSVLDLTGSASDLGLVLLANLVPRIVFMLVGGVWVWS